MTQLPIAGLSPEELNAAAERAISSVFSEHSLPLRHIIRLAVSAEIARGSGNWARAARALRVSRSSLYRRLGAKSKRRTGPSGP